MRNAILAGQVTNVVRGSSMDDEERLELDEQVEAEESTAAHSSSIQSMGGVSGGQDLLALFDSGCKP